jgi:streptomycin 6-kinase
MTDDLAGLAERQLERWELRRDGEPIHGSGSLVLPVRTSDGVPAVLKIPDAEHGHLVLRRWGGDGAVRLLSADPPHHAVLLERLGSQSLSTLPDVEACEVVAKLYRRLHVPALPQLHTLASFLAQRTDDFDALPRSAPLPHRLVGQAIALSRELAADPASTGTVIHTNLHYENVLAAEREPWLAISAKPMNGDPHYELAPMLWSRWDELAGRIREGVRRRFYTLVDAAGFDEERARAWVIIRVVDAAVRELPKADSTKYVALAKAVQD